MTKSEFIKEVAGKADVSQKQAAAILEAAQDVITEALREGEDVAIAGFGTFSAKERAAHEGRNPSTGEAITVAARKQVAFKPFKGFKASVNGD